MLRFLRHRKAARRARKRSRDISVATFIHIFNRRHRCFILWPLSLSLSHTHSHTLSLSPCSSENCRSRAFTGRCRSIIHRHGNRVKLSRPMKPALPIPWIETCARSFARRDPVNIARVLALRTTRCADISRDLRVAPCPGQIFCQREYFIGRFV